MIREWVAAILLTSAEDCSSKQAVGSRQQAEAGANAAAAAAADQVPLALNRCV